MSHSMEKDYYSEHEVPKELQPYISCIWFGAQNKSATHYIIPDNTIELIFSSAKIKRRQTGQNRTIELENHLAGLKTKPQEILLGKGKMVGVRFKPEGIYPFARMDAANLLNASIEPELIFGSRIKLLEKVIDGSIDDMDEAFLTNVISTYFLEEAEMLSHDPLVDRLMKQIHLTNGNVSMGKLAPDMSCSLKTLERRFKQKIGLTPKKYAGLYRCYQSILSMNESTDKLSDIAYDHGYFDHMHFIKEMKRYTSFSPKHVLLLKAGLQRPTLNR